MPWMIRLPSRMAVMPSPGMPRVSREKYAADQQAINFNDPFIVTGQDAIDLLAELQDVANENVKVLG